LLPRICIVTDRRLCKGSLVSTIKELVDIGFPFIQLREKDLSTKELFELAQAINEVTKGSVILVINDRVDIAKVLSIQGVHLGQNSLPPNIVKKHFPELLVGISIHSLAELESKDGYDYVFFGNVFETDCKPGMKGRGLEALKEIVKVSKKPVYAIGGINLKNVYSVLECGVYGIAVRSLAFNDGFDELLKVKNIIGEFYGGS
jgi:thiamine-phosphate pyrophosphorylase